MIAKTTPANRLKDIVKKYYREFFDNLLKLIVLLIPFYIFIMPLFYEDDLNFVKLKEGGEFANGKANILRDNEDLFQKEILRLAMSNPNISEDEKVSIKGDFCQLGTENANNLVRLADHYNCLGEIALKKGDEFEAIRTISYARKANDNSNHQKFLQDVLSGQNSKESQEILVKLNINPETLWIKDRDSETKFLEAALKSDNPTLKSRAAYRLSIIHSIGRNESLYSDEFDINKAFEMQRLASLGLAPSLDKPVIDIVFCINDPYVKYALSTMASILLTSNPKNQFRFTILYNEQDKITDQSKDLLPQALS